MSTRVNVNLSRLLPRAFAVFFLLLFLAAAPAGETVPTLPGAGSPMPVPVAAEEETPDTWSESWEGKVVAVEIKGAIMGKPLSDMPENVERALDKADADGARLVVLEIDSPGGEVGTCDKLSKRIFESKTPVVSLVVHKAISGGAMLASAAGEIVMTRTARMGDIQPMQMSYIGDAPTMDDRTAEKIEVDIRTIMKVYAHHYGRPAAVFEAMVSRASSLYQVKFEDVPTEYLTGHELELLEKNIELKRDERRIIDTRIIKPEGKLLELSAPQAMEYGIASETTASRDAFYASRDIAPEDVVRPAIGEGSFDLKDLRKLLPGIEDLGLPVWVIVLLGVFLIIGVAGFVTEYHAPGSGIPAAIGIIGIFCFFSTLVMYDRGSPLGIIIFLVGIALLVVEIMVLPGFGVAGILGILCIIGGMLLAFTPAWDSEYMGSFMWDEVGAFTVLIFVALVGSIAVILLLSKYGERLPYLGRFFLTDSQPAGLNPYPETLEEESRESARMRIQSLKGRIGVAETMLRPAGKVRLESGELLDVVTDGVYVEAGKSVVVLEAAPNRIVVGVERKGQSE